jgi:hypothetical protein
VFHLQQQMAETATVSESGLLRHRLTGESREVDVVIRADVGGHSVVVSLECIEHSRPADVTWVEQMKTKHDHLETHRLVLVSLSGFSKQAADLARTLGVETYTPEEATQKDWLAFVGSTGLVFQAYQFQPIGLELDIDTPAGLVRVAAGPDAVLYRPDLGRTGQLSELVMSILRDANFAARTMDESVTDGESTVQFSFVLDKETHVEDSEGRRHRIVSGTALVKAIRQSSPLDIKSMEFRGTPAAFGKIDTILGPAEVSILEPAPGEVHTIVHVQGQDTKATIVDKLNARPPGFVRFVNDQPAQRATRDTDTGDSGEAVD